MREVIAEASADRHAHGEPRTGEQLESSSADETGGKNGFGTRDVEMPRPASFLGRLDFERCECCVADQVIEGSSQFVGFGRLVITHDLARFKNLAEVGQHGVDTEGCGPPGELNKNLDVAAERGARSRWPNR